MHHPPLHRLTRHDPPRDPGRDFPLRVQEMRQRGASEETLHQIIDGLRDARVFFAGCVAAAAPDDPGRGTPEEPISAFQRAQILFDADQHAADTVFDNLRGNHLLVVGPFPYHLLDTMLMRGIGVVHLHERTPHGWAPHHFTELGHRGLNGVTDIGNIVETKPDALAVHAGQAGSQVLVVPDFVIARRLFPDVPVYALIDRHCPHGACAVEPRGFVPFPYTA